MPSPTRKRLILFLALCLALCAAGGAVRSLSARAQEPLLTDAQSRTGPTPPPEVLAHDRAKAPERGVDALSAVTLPVPAYSWRHGCGPTALGMVVGYYDGQGYPDLIPGSAATQGEAVNQAIASGGQAGSPFPPGSERHYEDYARPEDRSPNMLADDSISAGRVPHADDSIADFMFTSRSTHWNYYGWSWASHVGPAWIGYVTQRNAAYAPWVQSYSMGSTLTWSVLTGEIDAGRPMVFLVDSDANGVTDHFVAVIGYRTSPTQQYASLDTWYSDVRWEDFRTMAPGAPWGVWGGWSFHLAPAVWYTLQVSVQGAGEVAISPSPPPYLARTEVTLTAQPSTDWAFGWWTGDASGNRNPLLLNMTADKSVTAHFYRPATLTRRTHLPVAAYPR